MDTVVYSKTFSFKKIAYYSKRKINLPEVEVELKKEDGKYCLSICGEIWNGNHTDIVCGGQCLDTMNEYESLHNDPLFQKLYKLWKLHHLNDLHAGSISQEDALIAKFGKIPDYESACNYLKSIDLYEDENKYRYGSSWLYREIPEEDLKTIKELVCCQD